MDRGLTAVVFGVLLAAGGCAEPGQFDDGSDMRLTPCGSCSGKTPVCDPRTKRCLGCLADADCTAGQRCRANTCGAPCSAQSACDAGACDVDAGICTGCTSDADCNDPRTPTCDRASGRCGSCSPSKDTCPPGSYCGPRNGTNACIAGCKDDGECTATDAKCCAHACEDTSASASNCGACGHACKQAESCCDGSCVDTNSDPANCGGCAASCANLPHAAASCVAGGCLIDSCSSGWGNCDNNAGNGCEADLQNDSSNCGTCGNSCLIVCVLGICIL